MKLSTHWNLLCTAALFFALSASYADNPELKPGEGYVQVEGGKIWYRIIGEGSRAPLLMMHGGPGGTSRSFYLFEPLSADRPIILFDQLGSGRSDHHNDTTLLTVEHFVAQVEALTSALELESFYLHGHSWGTALALEYYSQYPAGVKGIIFNSPYFSTAIWTADADTLIATLPDSIQAAIRYGESTSNFSDEAYQEANVVFLQNFGLRGEPQRSKLDTVRSPFSPFVYNYMWGPTEFTATGTLKNYDNIESLKSIQVPVLFITGEYDEARPRTVQSFQNLVPRSSFAVIEGAGHATMHDNLEQNIEVIQTWLQEVEAGY